MNGPGTTIFAGVGLVMLVAMAGKTAFVDLPKKVEDYRNAQAAAEAEDLLNAIPDENGAER